MLDTDWVLSHIPKHGRPFTKIECYASWVYDQFTGKRYTNREYAKIWMISPTKAFGLMKEFEEITAKQNRNKIETPEVRNINPSQTGRGTKSEQTQNNNKLIYIEEEKPTHSVVKLQNRNEVSTAPLAFADATAPAMPEGTAPCTENPASEQLFPQGEDSSPVTKALTIEDLVDIWNLKICVDGSKISKVRTANEYRAKLLKKLMKTYPNIEDFETVFANIASSNYLQGKSSNGWCVDFDWMLKEQNFTKILEGGYNK